MGVLSVNDGDKWMKLLNGIDLHESLVHGVTFKEGTLPLLIRGGNYIIRLHGYGHDCLLLDYVRYFSLSC